MLVIVGTRTDAHSLRSQVGIGSESDCLLGQLDRIDNLDNNRSEMNDAGVDGLITVGDDRMNTTCDFYASAAERHIPIDTLYAAR